MATSSNYNISDDTNDDILNKNTNDKIKILVQENDKLNKDLSEQEEALFNEIQKNAKLEKANTELYEQVNFYKMEVYDLNQKLSFITNKINCDDIIKDLIYKQQAEIVSLKDELVMAKSASSQLKSRLKNQVEELKYIKHQSMQITSDMAKEVESQIADYKNQLLEANKTIENQKNIINSSKKTEQDYENIKSEIVKLQNKYKEDALEKEINNESLKIGIKALFSIINDLEKKNEDAMIFFNEAGEEILELKEKIKREKNDCNIIANEMGQEIINLSDQLNDYQQKVNELDKTLVINKEITKAKVISFCEETFSLINENLSSMKSDLNSLQSKPEDVDNEKVIEKIVSNIDKLERILNEHSESLYNQFEEIDNSREIYSNINDNYNSININNDNNDNDNNNNKNDNNNNNEQACLLLNEKINSIKKKYNDSLITINELGNELIEIKVQNDNNDSKIKTLSDIIIQLMQTVVDLEADKDALQKNVDEYLTIINDCGEDIRKLHFNEKDLITAISESGHEICVLKQTIQKMLNYQEKYQSMDGEVIMNKLETLTIRNQELEKELGFLRKFDINNSLKKSIEEGQLKSAMFEISKLHSHIEKLNQNMKQLENIKEHLENDLANARSEISSIISTRDEAIINQEEAIENLVTLRRIYAQKIHHIKNEIFRIYSSNPSEMNNKILYLVSELQAIPNMDMIQYETNLRNARYENIENKLREAEVFIESLTREKYEYQKELNKLNNDNEKLIAKLLAQNKRYQEHGINLSQSSIDSINNYITQDRRNVAYYSPSTSPAPIPPPHYSVQVTPLTSKNNNIPMTPPNINPSVLPPLINKSNNLMVSIPPHQLKVRRSIENLNKRDQPKRSGSQLYLQSSIKSPDSTSPTSIPKVVSNYTSLPDRSFNINESKEEYYKLLNHFGSIPHNNRISDIKDEYREMKDYMSFEIQNQNQIMEAIKSGEIPFYSSDNEGTEVLIINEDE